MWKNVRPLGAAMAYASSGFPRKAAGHFRWTKIDMSVRCEDWFLGTAICWHQRWANIVWDLFLSFGFRCITCVKTTSWHICRGLWKNTTGPPLRLTGLRSFYLRLGNSSSSSGCRCWPKSSSCQWYLGWGMSCRIFWEKILSRKFLQKVGFSPGSI